MDFGTVGGNKVKGTFRRPRFLGLLMAVRKSRWDRKVEDFPVMANGVVVFRVAGALETTGVVDKHINAAKKFRTSSGFGRKSGFETRPVFGMRFSSKTGFVSNDWSL